MSFKQTHEMQGTLKECMRELSHALGHCNYEVHGDEVIVRDHGRRLAIELIYEGDRHLGSLNLPMTQLNYEFIGYTQEEMQAFMKNLAQHMMREGG